MVKVWREKVTIPTYAIGKADKNPMFLEKRVYQGSSGVVYPYPVIEQVADEKTDVTYNAVWLENEYLKVMVLPELGGRIQMAYDKVKERHFVYYNHVIKPALVGLAGPWISGGIEFNWPQHHRPSTFLPVDCTIVENTDGSVTVWVNEMERMFHQKGMAGFTLRPGCAYLEIQGRVSNRTPLPQTFLWWANPAVEVNDDYQSVFPPDVNAVFDHGKRAVSSFPIATGIYYKMDYSAGVDISNYKNIKVPTSYMAVNSKYDFVGGYENDTHGGMLHVASHHLSPGKKQWTWGNGDFGRAWDRNLTDEYENKGYRPYIELMAGVYTENQPDFTWLMPYEEKLFTQYFMPYREIGIVKQASKDFILNIESLPDGGEVHFKVLATSRQTVEVALTNKQGETYYRQTVTLSPENVFEQTVDVKGATLDDLILAVGKLTWMAEPDGIRPIPDAAEAPLPPAETETNDQLYLTGLHLEQYRHATWSALDYYEEALRRDPNDVRCLNQTGLWYLRRGRFDKAEHYLRRAVKVWQKRNPNPYDGESIFNLALCLKFQALENNPQSSIFNLQLKESYELFWKSTWDKAWADAGYFEAACISVVERRLNDARDELDRCLIFNSHHHKARALKAAVLRLLQASKQKGGLQMGSSKELNDRLSLIKESLSIDHFNYGILYEQYLLTKDKDVLKELTELMHGNVYNYHELALDYAQAGLWDEAEEVLTIPAVAKKLKKASPLTSYYLAYLHLMRGETEKAKESFAEAEQADSYCCFPNRLEDVVALTMAKTMNPEGARAPYHLGCLYYDKRQYDLAIENWELAARLNPTFPTVWRNLALARFNKQGQREAALEYMERAFQLDKTDARVLMELDQLRKRLHHSHAERLAFLQKYPKLTSQRDDLVLEEITLLNQLGRHEEAMQKLDAHHFHPWEGGEGKVPAQYQLCRMELAKQHLAKQANLDKAIRLLNECLVYPPHLGEGKLYGAQDNDFHYLLGLAYALCGDAETARIHWEQAAQGSLEPTAAMYYNDAQPDKIFYQGLALLKLGRKDEADGRFRCLVSYGQQHLSDQPVADYFAVSLPDLLIWEDPRGTLHQVHCRYMLALGYYGLGDLPQCHHYLDEACALDPNHQGLLSLRTLESTLNNLVKK
jgi:tetratricopeptide (TPR) repeat protein